MTKADYLKKQLTEAYARLREAVFHDENPNEFLCDSIIQRFEFTFELAWKYLKAKMEEEGVEILSLTPKNILKTAFTQKLIADEKKWLKMLDTRNFTSHTYHADMAKDAVKMIRDEVDGFEEVL